MEERTNAIKFKTGQPVKGTFMFDTPLEGESIGRDQKVFKWYMYKFLDENGVEQVFFASKGLHKKLIEAGSLAKRKFKITKGFLKDEHGNIQEREKGGQPILDFEVELDWGEHTGPGAPVEDEEDAVVPPNF